VDSSVLANGGTAANIGGSATRRGGGGGSGGGILLNGATVTLNGTSVLSATGGNGGLGDDGSTAKRGEAGAGGRIAIYGDNISQLGTITVAGGTLDINGEDGTTHTAAFTPVMAFYWKGDNNSTWNALTVGNTNWSNSPSSNTDEGFRPVSTSDVFLSVDTSVGASNVSTSLGADTSIKSLTFTGTGTTAGTTSFSFAAGNTLTVGAGGITVDTGSAAHAINSNVVLGAAQSWTHNGSALLTVGGIVSGGGAADLTKAGSGTLVLDGASANTYTGLTSVNNGTLELSKPASTNAFAGNLVIGDGAGGTGTAVVRLAAAEQIPDLSTITINSDGVLDLFGSDETVGPLTLVSGQVDGSSGTDTLTLAATLNSSGTSSVGGANDTLELNGNDLNVTGGTLTVTRNIVDGAGNQLVKNGPGTLEIGGGATLGGPGVDGIDIQDGTVAITGGTVDLQGGNVQTNGNMFNLAGGILQNVDTIFGTLDQTGGTLINSLNSPDTMTITGDYNQTGGTLVVDIAGESLGQYDIYSVGGSATLDGALKVNLLAGYQPESAEPFWDVVVASVLTIGPSFSLDLSMAALANPQLQWAYERVDLGGGLFALRLYLIATPEPASVLVWGVAGVAALLYARRRRDRSAGGR